MINTALAMPKLSTAIAIQSLNGPRGHVGWTFLVESHGSDIWRVIYSMVRKQHEAEDLYQEFWLLLPKAARSFIPVDGDVERAARSWLLRVAYTTTVDEIRRRRSQPLAQTITDYQTESDADSSAVVCEKDDSDCQVILKRAHQAISELPENYRRPLLLYVVGGLSYDELAADLNCTVNNARVRVHRGLKRIREIAGFGESTDNDRQLAGIIVPVILAVPAAPAMPMKLGSTLGSKLPLGSKALNHTGKMSWYHSPMIGVSASIIGSLFVGVIVISKHSDQSSTIDKTVSAVPASLPITTILDNFERSELDLHVSGQGGISPEQEIAPATLGDEHGRSYSLQWGADHHAWIDAGYNKGFRSEIPELRLNRGTVIALSVWTDAIPLSITHLGIRFIDSKGEIFGYRQPLTALDKEWKNYTFSLDESSISYWSDNEKGNQSVDYPISLFGFVVGLDMTINKPGMIKLDDIRLQDASKMFTVTKK